MLHLLPAPLHPCTSLHFPPPLYKSSSPAPLGAPAPSNRKPATVRTRRHRRPPASVLCFNELLPRARRRVFSLPGAHNHHNLLRRVSSCNGGSAPTISCCKNKLISRALVNQTKLSLHRQPFVCFVPYYVGVFALCTKICSLLVGQSSWPINYSAQK